MLKLLYGKSVSKVSKLLLARHGETVWNVEKRLQGQDDSQLTDKGVVQAKQLADKIAAQNISRVFSSTLGRAQATADITTTHTAFKFQTMQGLEERSFGQWQGKHFAALTNQPYYQEIFHQVTTHTPPQGESAKQVATRFKKALKRILVQHPNEHCLVISHGEILRCFLSTISTNIVGDAYKEFTNGCVIPLSYDHINKQFSLI